MKASIALAFAAALFAGSFAIPSAFAAADSGKKPEAKEQAQALDAAHEAKIQDIKKLIGLTQTPEAFDKMLDGTIEMMTKNIPPSQAQEMDAFFTAFRLEFTADSFIAKLTDTLIPIYDKNFTHDEIKQLIAFHASPLGKKILLTSPDIQIASTRVGMEMGQEAARKAMMSVQKSKAVQSAPAKK